MSWSVGRNQPGRYSPGPLRREGAEARSRRPETAPAGPAQDRHIGPRRNLREAARALARPALPRDGFRGSAAEIDGLAGWRSVRGTGHRGKAAGQAGRPAGLRAAGHERKGRRSFFPIRSPAFPPFFLNDPAGNGAGLPPRALPAAEETTPPNCTPGCGRDAWPRRAHRPPISPPARRRRPGGRRRCRG